MNEKLSLDGKIRLMLIAGGCVDVYNKIVEAVLGEKHTEQKPQQILGVHVRTGETIVFPGSMKPGDLIHLHDREWAIIRHNPTQPHKCEGTT